MQSIWPEKTHFFDEMYCTHWKQKRFLRALCLINQRNNLNTITSID